MIRVDFGRKPQGLDLILHLLSYLSFLPRMLSFFYLKIGVMS